ncbi:GntR family transcriptional regulator [Andreprevotia lacus DSM 23236]|jgi:GntR family transcriptional regulator|uniref:GntR family transcriptional regulator n=1 Tax=Andreprevotia lacus DSM 23236 TaxID=1121001 RepID=A0A1W1Y1D1_9NEIS|nr:GntR family transcriptional regulator [Andreprevotia lacus]SMC29611.1 GntR family transcriptional regulator [Andreprevotia lacus DSM 23236]
MPLSRHNVTSLYQQIASTLQAEINAGRFEPSGKLPSEAELVVRFAVSRVTVRQALARLTDDGVVERKQGKGTYASGKRIRHGLDTLSGFFDALVAQGITPQMRLLDKKRVPVPPALQGLFGGATECLQLTRLHLVDGEPVALACSHLPAAVDALSWEYAEQHATYTLLANSLGQPVDQADLAIRAQAAEREQARLLGVKTNSPLLVMARVSHLADGSVCDHTVFYIRPERYEFVVSSASGARLSNRGE